MLDTNFIRENVDIVKQAIKNRNEKANVERVLELDRLLKNLKTEAQMLKEQRNRVTDEIARTKKSGRDATESIAEMREVSKRIGGLDGEIRSVENELRRELLRMPNVPHRSVPTGPDESFSIEVRSWGKKPEFDFTPAPHWELGEKLGLFDLPRGAKVCGTGFLLFTGTGARLERALIDFMLDIHSSKHGFVEVSPPFVSTEESMIGCGYIPKLKDSMYQIRGRSFYLTPTAEVPVTSIHRDEVLPESALPVKYVAYTPCFRREAGSHGKDTRGLIRVHQFDEVEMVMLTQPETSWDALEEIVSCAETVLQALELPYRVRIPATGDLPFAAAKCYELEVYSAGVEKYLEVSSCSNYEDFQARRMNIRYKPHEGGKSRLVHTLNGSGLTLPRTVIALLENFQTEGGSVRIPEALRPFLGGMKEIS